MSDDPVPLQPQSKRPSNLAYVDHLRGIAILMVITVHAAEATPNLSAALMAIARYGQSGVQLFFVVSAYTLCRSHFFRETETHATLRFYVRRFFRIAPLYYVAICMYWFNSLLVHDWHYDPNYKWTNLLANMLFVHGFVPPANNVVVPGGWSIGTEMAFYAVYPALISLYGRVFSRFGSPGAWALAAVSVALSGIGIIVYTHFSGAIISTNSFLYFNLLVQGPVFLFGMAAFFQYTGTNRSIAKPEWSFVAFAFFTFASKLLMHHETGPALILQPAISALSFVFLLDICRSLSKQWRVLARIGQVSYSIYIFHFLFVWNIAGAIMTWSNKSRPSLDFAIILVASVALTFALARLTEAQIEKRGIAIGRKICSLRWLSDANGT